MLASLDRRKGPVVVAHIQYHIYVLTNKAPQVIGKDILEADRRGNAHLLVLKHIPVRTHTPIGDLVLLKDFV